MTLISVRELMVDPDFLSALVRARPTVTLGNEGQAKRTYVETTLFAAVQPAGAADLVDLAPEGERLGNWIVIYSAGSILATNANTSDSDIVKWQGSSYRVMKVLHWEMYGYYQAFAKGFVPGTPTTTPSVRA